MAKMLRILLSALLLFASVGLDFRPSAATAAAAKSSATGPPADSVILGEDATLTVANLHGAFGPGEAASFGQTAASTASVGAYQDTSAGAYVGSRFDVSPGANGMNTASAEISLVFSYNAKVDFNAVPPNQNGGGSAHAKIDTSIAGDRQTIEDIHFIHNADFKQTSDTTAVTATTTLRAGDSYDVVAELMTTADIYIGHNAVSHADVTLDHVKIKFLPAPPPPPALYTVTLGQDATFTAANFHDAVGTASAAGQEASSTTSLGPHQSGQSWAQAGFSFKVLPGSDPGRTEANADIAVTFRYNVSVDFDPLPVTQSGGGSAEAKVETFLPGPFRTIERIHFVHYGGSKATSDTTTVARIVSPMRVNSQYRALAKVTTLGDLYAGNTALAHADITIEQITVKFYSSEPVVNPDPYVVPLGQDATFKTSNIHYTSGDEAAAAWGQTATATVVAGPQESGIANAIVGSRFSFVPGPNNLMQANAKVSITFSYNVEIDHNAITGDGGGGSGDASARTNVMGMQEFHEGLANGHLNVVQKKGTGAKTVTYDIGLEAGLTRDVYAAVYTHADIYAGVLSVAHADMTINEIKIDFTDTAQEPGNIDPPQSEPPDRLGTRVSLKIKPKAVKAGGTVLARGRLVDEAGHGRGGKKISIKVGKKVVKKRVTNAGGFFKAKIKIRKKVLIRAIFKGDDYCGPSAAKAIAKIKKT